MSALAKILQASGKGGSGLMDALKMGKKVGGAAGASSAMNGGSKVEQLLAQLKSGGQQTMGMAGNTAKGFGSDMMGIAKEHPGAAAGMGALAGAGGTAALMAALGLDEEEEDEGY